ncbi:DUF4405 domain-containing protein [Desulfosporosinus sp. PR]|uniref:DUF4405 domain-containing protein n=1 Tax=Candidatus Desulfosporosinus nitrosoreducens TaxID=3401928 RepID=UPI0027FD1946|nr:DUF4405 domain-containing protein [Desulfosporosinus sp. PR]MDQ7097031.1 DUF4405 domain-containing protein [Desulfosporosinus sp. PR]
MNRSRQNFLLDTILVLLLTVIAVTGLLVWFVFPFDSGRDDLSALLEEIHKWTALMFVAASVYHFFVHWEWYKTIFRSLPRNKN